MKKITKKSKSVVPAATKAPVKKITKCQALELGHKACPCGAKGCGVPGTND